MTKIFAVICLVATTLLLAQAADQEVGSAQRLNNLTWEVLKLDQQPICAGTPASADAVFLLSLLSAL